MTDMEGFVNPNIQIELDSILPRCTMRSGTRSNMVSSHLKSSRPAFGERIQPLKAMFSRATLGLGRLYLLVKEGCILLRRN